ncbi:hypothetical protein AMATHDRAFT_59509 [Amanita thiersii Skay4041]|uniref:Uncharacterized protein n=1 Tax=Amanita thiersii Skay4041 TaxID=703135 RepID=A0A2A9NJR6_9AGAR|nr:hypothetical protein AMATHDRAFT_59509 [Amanita thiersii Skay4041]
MSIHWQSSNHVIPPERFCSLLPVQPPAAPWSLPFALLNPFPYSAPLNLLTEC